MWCTDDYANMGIGYRAGDEIKIELIIGENDRLIVPRALKPKEQQRSRTRVKAEVFTPTWLCNEMINDIDEATVGRPNVFNTSYPDRTWTPVPGPIELSDNVTWQDYVRYTRLEITCGEAPFLVSRYDTVSGKSIPVPERIGMLDRKLRLIAENIDDYGQWLKWVKIAYQNIYGYEWQGDNLLLARETLLFTFIDYQVEKFGPDYPIRRETLRDIAYIISWNLWQMDGLKCVVPNSCGMKPSSQQSIFEEPQMEPCRGCLKDDIRAHNGIYTYIRDWSIEDEEKGKVRFVDLMKKK